MKILFTFENPLPSREADAEVFTATAAALSRLAGRAWLHLPVRGRGVETPPALPPVLPARAPRGPALLRHLLCGLALPTQRAFRDADLVYTRNLWVAFVALAFGQRVVFDHYRPWPDQIPPLQPFLRALMGHPRFLLNVCHSDYTRDKYLELGVPPARLACVRNGFAPERFAAVPSTNAAKEAVGLPASRPAVVYAGRVNRRKGLELLIEAASRRPDILLLLVGSAGEGPIETLARDVANVRLVPWQPPEAIAAYLAAADILVVPPSTRPLAEFGTTVLPLKLFLYLASGRQIVAGRTPDVQEVLRHGENAYLCQPDDPDALAGAIDLLLSEPDLATGLGARARADSLDLTWEARARRIMAELAPRVARSPAPSSMGARLNWQAWRAGCRRWLVHALRHRSVVLPPAAATRLPAELAERA